MKDQTFKYDGEKLEAALVPGKTLEALAVILTHGAHKYQPGSWVNVEPERYFQAAARHFFQLLRHGVDHVDKESGLPTLWHLLTDLAFLVEFSTREPQDFVQHAIQSGKEAKCLQQRSRSSQQEGSSSGGVSASG